MWHVLVEVDGTIPRGPVEEALRAHPALAAVSVNAPAPPPAGWRRPLAGLGRTRPASVLVGVEVDERAEAERIARAAVEEALARVGVEARVRIGSFR